jgi:hypothetical protein
MVGAVGGCGLMQDIQSVTRELGKSSSQDEVVGGAPLSIPPDISLRPPSSSASAISGEGATRRAQVILRGSEGPAAGPGPVRGETRQAGPSDGEREILARSGYSGATSDVVRRTVDIEGQRRSAGQREFTDRVLKYDPKAKPAASNDKNARDATGDRPVIKRPGEF